MYTLTFQKPFFSTELMKCKSNLHTETGLLGQLTLEELLTLLLHVLRFDTHDATTPGAANIDVVVERVHEAGAQGVQVLLVLGLDGRHGEAGGGLLANQLAEAGLALAEQEYIRPQFPSTTLE